MQRAGSQMARRNADAPMPNCAVKTRLGRVGPASSSIWRAIVLKIGKLGRHCRVASSKLLDRNVLRLVVRKTKVPIGAN